MRRAGRVAIASGLLALGAAAPLRAQERELPVFGTELRVVALPVFVTGKDGKAVPGLGAADFEVEEQGKKVPIVAFLAVDAGAAVPAADAPGVSPATAAAAHRQLLFLFDLSFATPSGIVHARDAALEFLRKGLGPTDLVAVATISQAGPKVLVGFTSDLAQAGHAIATLGMAEGERLRDPLGLASDLGIPLEETSGAFGLGVAAPGVGRAGAEESRDLVLQLARTDRAAYGQRVVGYMGGLQGFGQLLDSVQGRKQVILFSAGFDVSVLAGAQGAERVESSRSVTEGRLWEVGSEGHFGDAVAQRGLDSLLVSFARSDTVVHTVDVGGLSVGSDPAELGPVRPGSTGESLAQIASATGGRFIKNTNDLEAGLRDVLDASRYFYVLAFEPSSQKQKPGELRKLKVKLRQPGLDVSHRAAYVVPTPELAGAAPVRQLAAGDVISKGLSGGAIVLDALAVPYRDGKGQILLPVVLQIDGASLLGKASGQSLAIEVYGYALDAQGRILDAFGISPTLALDKVGASVRSKGVQVISALRARPGTVDLRFLVRDTAGGRLGALRRSAEVPAFDDGALYVSTPLLLDDPRARLVIPTPSRARPRLEIPFRLGELPFTPEAAASLKNGEPREICLMVSGVAPTAAAALKLQAQLVDAAGTAQPLGAGAPRLVPDADGVARLVFGVRPERAPRGEYRLQVRVAEASGGRSGASELRVRIQ